MAKNYFFRMRNRQFEFSPKMQWALAAERSEAVASDLLFPFWCWGEDSNLQWVAPLAPKASASTNFATPASSKAYYDLLYFTHAPIAQLVEQIPLKDKVPGSSPGRRT